MYIGEDPVEFKKCSAINCERLIHVGTNYCCWGCGASAEIGCGVHESGPLAHSEGCNERWSARQAVIKSAPRKPSYRNVVIPVFDMGKFIEGVERYRRSKKGE